MVCSSGDEVKLQESLFGLAGQTLILLPTPSGQFWQVGQPTSQSSDKMTVPDDWHMSKSPVQCFPNVWQPAGSTMQMLCKALGNAEHRAGKSALCSGFPVPTNTQLLGIWEALCAAIAWQPAVCQVLGNQCAARLFKIPFTQIPPLPVPYLISGVGQDAWHAWNDFTGQVVGFGGLKVFRF